MITKMFPAFLGILIICSFATKSFSEDTNFGKRIPDVNEITKALTPDKYNKSRSIVLVSSYKTKAISMEISFESNSYKIASKAQKILDVLAQSLKSDTLIKYPFIIEGHTDAYGEETYNLNLSKKRAEEVSAYLINQHQIDKNRLKVVGKGESEALIKDSPYDAKNRRVRIINAGD